MAKMIWFTGAETEDKALPLSDVMPGVKSGRLYHDEKTGVAVAQSSIAPNGVIPGHKGAGSGLFQIVSGSGTIYVETEEGTVVNQVTVNAGDVLFYHASDYKHRYEAGSHGLTYTGIGFPR
jgi:quercetin dioxygenase-like cupin family protein